MRQQVCAPGTQVAFNGATNRYRYVCTAKSTSISKGRYAGGAATDEPTAPFVPTRKSVSE